MPPRLEIVGRPAQALVSRSVLGRLTRPDRLLAEAILRTLHDRHVGITPELAADLVRLMRAVAQGQPATGLWAPLLDHLNRSSMSQAAVVGRLSGIASSYGLSRVIEPLVARACDDIGELYLFSDSSCPEPRGFAGAYAAYRRRLHNRLGQLLSDKQLPELFWIDRAMTLAAISRPPAAHSTELSDLPEVDLPGLAHLLRLQPRLPQLGRQRLRQRRSPVRASHLRPMLSRNEGGVDGIHQTRRLADLPSILLSELLQPPELLLDRLLSSGYLALRRPPEQQRRDGCRPAAAPSSRPIRSLPHCRRFRPRRSSRCRSRRLRGRDRVPGRGPRQRRGRPRRDGPRGWC